MSDVEKQLTDPDFIKDELFKLLTSGEDFTLSVMECWQPAKWDTF